MVREKILLWRRVNPKKVSLPDGRTFYAKYESASRKNLPANVTIKKARAIGMRRGRKRKQQEAGILGSVFKLGRKIIEEGIKQTPSIDNAGVKRRKNN